MAITIYYSSLKMWKRYLQKEAANTTEKSNRPVLYITCNCLLFLENTLIVFVLCKIYREKTIEVGVYIDRHLYKNMEEVFVQVIFSSFYPFTLIKICNQPTNHVSIFPYHPWKQPSERILWNVVTMLIWLQMLKTEDEVKVKAQLLRMVHSLFLQVFLPLIFFCKIATLYLCFQT